MYAITFLCKKKKPKHFLHISEADFSLVLHILLSTSLSCFDFKKHGSPGQNIPASGTYAELCCLGLRVPPGTPQLPERCPGEGTAACVSCAGRRSVCWFREPSCQLSRCCPRPSGWQATQLLRTLWMSVNLDLVALAKAVKGEGRLSSSTDGSLKGQQSNFTSL